MSAPTLDHHRSTSVSQVIDRVLSGEVDQFEIIMRRYNRRMYRVARSIMGVEDQVEDVMQAAYVKAFRHLDQFAGRASLSTWLTRIVIHEALACRKKALAGPGAARDASVRLGALACERRGPFRQASDNELADRINEAIDALPTLYRLVFIMRAVEGMSTADTARALNVNADVVKSRLSRAKARLRHTLQPVVKVPDDDVYPFHLRRCGRVVQAVMRVIVDRP